jgi:hypothetical protein
VREVPNLRLSKIILADGVSRDGAAILIYPCAEGRSSGNIYAMPEPKPHSLTDIVALASASAATTERVVQAAFDLDPGGDGKIVREIGRVTLAWNQIDNVLRVVLKRLRDQSFERGTANYVYDIPTHHSLCIEILASIEDSRLDTHSKMDLEALIRGKIGMGRREGLYAQFPLPPCLACNRGRQIGIHAARE